MRVAIDVGPLSSGHAVRGVGFYTKRLIEALGDRVEAVDSTATDLTKYDLIHYPAFDLFRHTLPIVKQTKTIVTIHDTIPLIYPTHYPPGVRGKINFYLQKYSLRSVSAIITDTETSKKDICRFLGVIPDKVHVVYLAPGEMFRKMDNGKRKMEIKKRFGLPDRFAVYLGDVNYNKNIPVLIDACKIAKIPLVICGKQAKEVGDRDRKLNHPELTHLRSLDWNNVVTLGFVSDEELVAIFNLASVYVQPSLYEGFGLPVLQAFACGTPVVAAKTQALVEIGNPGCLFVDPNDPEDVAEKIEKIIEDDKLRKQLIETGKVIAKNFSWEKTAKETMKVYRKAIGSV